MYREHTHTQPKIDNTRSPVTQMYSKEEGIETPADATDFWLAEYMYRFSLLLLLQVVVLLFYFIISRGQTAAVHPTTTYY